MDKEIGGHRYNASRTRLFLGGVPHECKEGDTNHRNGIPQLLHYLKRHNRNGSQGSEILEA